MRLFLALYPPEHILSELKAFLGSASPSWPVRWTLAEQLHATLKFLEKVNSDQLSRLEDEVARVTAATAPITLSLRGGGIFPAKGHPSVFWVGLADESEALKRLADQLNLACEKVGFPIEKHAFHAHLTIARLTQRNCDMRALRSEFSSWISNYSSQPFNVEKIMMMESRLLPKASLHTTRRIFGLGNIVLPSEGKQSKF